MISFTISITIISSERGTCKENDHTVSHDGKFGQNFNTIQIISNSVGNFGSESSWVAKVVNLGVQCNDILKNNPKYNIALYHKERILFSMENFDESILCCNHILNDYPNNGDVLFDKSCNFVMLTKYDEALDLLEHAISQGIQYKIKAKKSKIFKKLLDNPRFKKLIL